MLNELQYLDEHRGWMPHYQRICWTARQNAGPQKVAKLPHNRRLNRYRDVLPFDQSRVVLKGGETDYINANFVEAPDVDRRYVLTQGPLPNTAHHFWQMIWELNSTAIVMLNKVIEKNQIKCHQYWPAGESADHEDELIFGNFRIQFLSDKRNQYYIVRSLEIENLETGESRVVSHYHYTTWPDFGVPSSPSTFLAFLFEIRNAGAFSKDVGPTVIHCSAGIGRSGTLIMVDTVLEMIAKSQDMDSVDISETLLKLREYRTGLIQTADQLRFTYIAIAEAVSILLPDIYEKSIENLQKPEVEEVEPPPVPPRAGRRKISSEPSAGTSTEPEAAKRPKTEQLLTPTESGSVEILCVRPKKLKKTRRKNKNRWKGIGRFYSCTKRQSGLMSSSEGSDEGPDEIIDLSSSDLSSDDQPVCVITKEDESEENKDKTKGSTENDVDAAESKVEGVEKSEKVVQGTEGNESLLRGAGVTESEMNGVKRTENKMQSHEGTDYNELQGTVATDSMMQSAERTENEVQETEPERILVKDAGPAESETQNVGPFESETQSAGQAGSEAQSTEPAESEVQNLEPAKRETQSAGLAGSETQSAGPADSEIQCVGPVDSAIQGAKDIEKETRPSTFITDESQEECKSNEIVANLVTVNIVQHKIDGDRELSEDKGKVIALNSAQKKMVEKLNTQEDFELEKGKSEKGMESTSETRTEKSKEWNDRDPLKMGRESAEIAVRCVSDQSDSNSAAREVMINRETVSQSLAESDSSVRQNEQDSNAHIVQEGISDVSEEEVVIGRITVIGSEGIVDSVESDNKNINQSKSLSDSPVAKDKILKNIHQENDEGHSQESQEVKREPHVTHVVKEQGKKEEVDQESQLPSQDKRPSEKEVELRRRREDRKQKTSELIHNIKAKVKQEEQSRRWKAVLKDALVTFTVCTAVATVTYYCYRYFTAAT